MKKISTVQAISNEILKEQKLTIGVDLGDRWSFYCVLMKQANHSGAESSNDTASDEADVRKNTAESERTGDRNTFALGKPAVDGAGTRSARGARAKGGIDHQEQSKR